MLDTIHNERQNNIVAEETHMHTDRLVMTQEHHAAKHKRRTVRNGRKIENSSPNVSDAQIVHLNKEQPIDDQEKSVEDAQIVTLAVDPPIIGMDQVVEFTNEASNPPIPTVVHEVKMDLPPIVGYAAEQLLPLPDACAPLTHILHNLSTYVQMALDETPQTPPDGLTIDESAAVRLYTIEWDGPHRSLYSMLNYTLKSANRDELLPYYKYLKLFLTALAKIPCAPLTTVWRGVTKDLSADCLPGTSMTWWAFSSCTTSLTVLENSMYLGTTGTRTLFSVETINGRSITAHSHFVTEDELLLLPGTHMIVVSQLTPAPDLYIIHLKQVIPEETLLELPFE
ncbi:unnamed protein product, partial [Rotaria magnacalcarata]